MVVPITDIVTEKVEKRNEEVLIQEKVNNMVDLIVTDNVRKQQRKKT